MKDAKDTPAEISKISDDVGEDGQKRTSNKPCPNPEQPDTPQPEGGWGWIVCLASFMTNGAVFGIINSFGIIYKFLLSSPQIVAVDRSLIAFKISWVGSVSLGTFFATNFLAGLSCDRFGLRQTGVFGAVVASLGMLASAFVTQLELYYLTFGIVLGTGAGFLFAPSMVVLGHYFKDRIGLVSGLVNSGSSLYTIILSLSLTKFLNAINLQFTFFVLCGLYVITILGALSWKPVLKKKEKPTEYRDETTCGTIKRVLNLGLLKNRKFLVWFLAVDVAMTGHFVVQVHLIKHSTDRFPESDGDLLLTIMQVSAFAFRVFFGRLSDSSCVNRISLHQTAYLVYGVLTVSVPFIPSFLGLAVLTFLIGVLEGLMIMLFFPIVIDILGPHAASGGMGILYGSFSVFITLGSPIAGFLYDTTGNYTASFIVAGCFRIAGALLMCIIRHKHKASNHLTFIELSVHMFTCILQNVNQNFRKIFLKSPYCIS